MQPARTLLAVPNFSEGRDEPTIAAIASAFQAGGGGSVRALDLHSDADHHRSVITLAGPAGTIAGALLAGTAEAVAQIDVMARAAGASAEVGQHPHVGAVDVVPLVYLREEDRGAACAEALVAAELIASRLELPVFLYGELTAGEDGRVRTRAELRRGGVLGLAERMAATPHPLCPDFGPPRMHPSAGATLLAARPPLVAFNLVLAPPADLAEARRVAALVREGAPEGLPGLRAIGIELEGGLAQVSMNVERPFEVPLGAVVEAVCAYADVHSAELVGLAPAAALAGFPAGLQMPGFDPARHLIENALGS
jgi:glutamate formiminotransferase / 5-formyltetrahydrofolate cyclo-ligase